MNNLFCQALLPSVYKVFSSKDNYFQLFLLLGMNYEIHH